MSTLIAIMADVALVVLFVSAVLFIGTLVTILLLARSINTKLISKGNQL